MGAIVTGFWGKKIGLIEEYFMSFYVIQIFLFMDRSYTCVLVGYF